MPFKMAMGGRDSTTDPPLGFFSNPTSRYGNQHLLYTQLDWRILMNLTTIELWDSYSFERNVEFIENFCFSFTFQNILRKKIFCTSPDRHQALVVSVDTWTCLTPCSSKAYKCVSQRKLAYTQQKCGINLCLELVLLQ